jgi:hypothetical protein
MPLNVPGSNLLWLLYDTNNIVTGINNGGRSEEYAFNWLINLTCLKRSCLEVPGRNDGYTIDLIDTKQWNELNL